MTAAVNGQELAGVVLVVIGVVLVVIGVVEPLLNHIRWHRRRRSPDGRAHRENARFEKGRR